MDVSSAVRSYLRKPLFVALVAVAALLAGAFGWSRTTITYTAGLNAVVTPPRSDSDGRSQNPLAGIDSNTPQIALVVASMAQTAQVSDAVSRTGGTLQPVDTTVGADSSSPVLTPQLKIMVQAPTEEQAVAGASEALTATQQQLDALQARNGISRSNQQVKLLKVADPAAQPSSQTSRLRAAVGYAAGVALLGGALTVFLGARDARRGRGRHGADESRAERDDRPGPDRSGGGPRPDVEPAPSPTRPTSPGATRASDLTMVDVRPELRGTGERVRGR